MKNSDNQPATSGASDLSRDSDPRLREFCDKSRRALAYPKSHIWCRGRMAIALLVAICSVPVAGRATDPAVATLAVAPAEFTLQGSRARQQLLVSGRFSASSLEEADFTREATYESLVPTVALVNRTGLVVPRGHGTAEILVRYGKLEQRVRVHVSTFGEAHPVDFNTEVVAALSRAGCNQGACHGSPQGKNGFRLSLRGFDPALDFVTLAREDFGRRTNPFTPDESLVLKKGGALVPHQGGRRFRTHDSAYLILRSWIAERCRPSVDPRKLVRLEVLPDSRRLPGTHPAQQLVALAHFDDGSVRDVSDLAVYSSSQEATASVSVDGLVEFKSTGEASFLVRYLGQITAANMTYVRPDPAYVFSGPSVANYVDEYVFARQRELQLLPTTLAPDGVFLRRVYLDAIGVLPTAEESRSFLDSPDPGKRAKLIDELLNRDEFAAFWALKWADLMRGSDVTISNRGVHSFHRYLVQTFREDRPFNEFARETLTSLGNTLHKPAANFYRVARTPDEAAEAMAQLFLGLRIGCAKCHNHPFEAITQEDYYGLAAYFARIRYKGKQFGTDEEIVFLERSGEVRQPGKNVNIAPIAFGTPAGELAPDEDRRAKLADWLTSPDNRYFVPSTVNRLWYHLIGKGIVDPVDDFRDTNPPSNRALLDALSADFVKHGYRIKPILRVILNSSTYQLGAESVAHQSTEAADPDRYFTHSLIRMLSAEQLLDAISAATGLPQEFKGYPPGTRAVELAEGAVDHPFLKASSKPVRDVTCECAREDDPSLNQVIHLLNNPSIVGNLKSPQGQVGRWLAAGKSDAELLDLVYLGTLSRHPTASEIKLVTEYLATVPDRAAGFFDLQHALIISNEFLLRH